MSEPRGGDAGLARSTAELRRLADAILAGQQWMPADTDEDRRGRMVEFVGTPEDPYRVRELSFDRLPGRRATDVDADVLAGLLSASGVTALVGDVTTVGELRVARNLRIERSDGTPVIVRGCLRDPRYRAWQWQWPMRLTVLDGPSADQAITSLRHDPRFIEFAQLTVGDGLRPCELLVVVDPESTVPSDHRAQVIAYCSREPETLADDADALAIDAALGATGMLATVISGYTPGWIGEVVHQLTADRTIAEALCAAEPEAVVIASTEAADGLTLSAWAQRTAHEIAWSQPDIADEIAAGGGAIIAGADDDARRAAAARLIGSVERAWMAGVVLRLHALMSGPPVGAAPDDWELDGRGSGGEESEPPPPAPSAAPPPPAPSRPPPAEFALPRSRSVPRDGDFQLPTPVAAEPPSGAEPEPPERRERRRLQTVVRRVGRLGRRAATDRWTASRTHDIRVCIAAERKVAAAAVASVAFANPQPGEDVDLDVFVIVDGQRHHRPLRLPAHDDSAWTEPVEFTTPANVERFEVLVEVAAQNRVLQTAVLAGRPFALSVDTATPLERVAERQRGGALVTIVASPTGEPTIVDLDRDAASIDERQVASATKSLRAELLAAFLAPPADLAGAARALTRLAVRGSTLYRRLAGAGSGYHDDVDWIHVSAFGAADVPLELIYTHPMPDDDEQVPICDESLAGATSCGSGCASRQRSDVVCPYGFWATSKIVERRCHVAGRQVGAPAAERQVHPLQASVVGISLKADEADATASARIRGALDGNVASVTLAESWASLESAADHHPPLVVLVTHTVASPTGDDLETALELNGDLRKIHRIDAETVNPGGRQPGPVVLALGCDTDTLTAGFTDLVVNLHAASAEIVVSALSPIPGSGVADFLERFLPALSGALAGGGPHRFGAAMLAARQATIADGNLMALALTTSGDADVELAR